MGNRHGKLATHTEHATLCDASLIPSRGEVTQRREACSMSERGNESLAAWGRDRQGVRYKTVALILSFVGSRFVIVAHDCDQGMSALTIWMGG